MEHAIESPIRPGAIVFESLKKRRRGVYRAVPVPPKVLEMLEMVHGLKDRKKKPSPALGIRAHDGLEEGARGDESRRRQRAAGNAEGAAAWVWSGRDPGRHPAQPPAPQ